MLAIASALEGELYGDGNLLVERVAHPADVMSGRDLVFATDKKLLPLLINSSARAAILAEDAEIEPGILDAFVSVKRPRLAMARLNALFFQPVSVEKGISPLAVIEEGVQLAEDVAIGAHVFVGRGATIQQGVVLHPGVYVAPGAVIGARSVLHSGVRVGADVVLGMNCLVHFNAVIGSDGFSFVTPTPGSVEVAKATGVITATNHSLVRIASLGSVVVGDDVEIGSNTSIDRGTIASTRIGNGTKIDNQVQIGHNVVIGENCLLCGRVGVAGSAVIGNRVVLGGAVGVADHVTIGDDAVAMAMSGIAGNVAPKQIVGGIPARPKDQATEIHINIGRLKSLYKKVDQLLQRVDSLEQPAKNK